MSNINAIEFSIKSMVDDFGRVFFHNNKVYRAIYPDSVPFCHELLNSELFKELTRKRLIPDTNISDFNLPGYELVLEHEKLMEVQQHEWSFEILKEASLTVLQINEICNKHGYELKDAHTFNILFRGTRPVYSDIGSIIKKKGVNWTAYSEFICVFYLPLIFWQQGDIYIVRKLVESTFYKMQTAPFQNIINSKLISLIKDKPFNYFLKYRNVTLFHTGKCPKLLSLTSRAANKIIRLILKKPLKLFQFEMQIVGIETIRQKIENLSKKEFKSEWSGYHQSNYLVNNTCSEPRRFHRIIEIIQSYEDEINSAIDLAGNEGFFTELLFNKTKIPKLILTDNDSNAIDFAFIKFKELYHNRLTIALLNFVFTNEIENTAKRFKSDLVIALAITHHLVLKQQYSLDVIFDRLQLFSNKYVLVEFMPLGLWSKNTKTGFSPPYWYNYNWFKTKFENHFDLIITEKLEENRIIFFGRVRNL